MKRKLNLSNNPLPPPFHCVKCWDFLGERNPRQLCGKIKCLNDCDNMEPIKLINIEASPFRTNPTKYNNECFESIGKYIEHKK